MLKKINQKTLKTAGLFNMSLAMLLLFGLSAFAQTTNTQTATTQTPVEKSATLILQPVLTNYKAVKIGTTDEEVRDKLGKAEIDDKDGFYYKISDNEIVQIRIDKNKKVRLLAVTYSGENAPKYTDVFGAEAKVETKPDGSIYKLVRYPKAGYWVAYSRTSGEKPTVTVTMQKMRTIK